MSQAASKCLYDDKGGFIMHRPKIILLPNRSGNLPFINKNLISFYSSIQRDINKGEEGFYVNHKHFAIEEGNLKPSKTFVHNSYKGMKHGDVKKPEHSFDNSSFLYTMVKQLNSWIRGEELKESFEKPLTKLKGNLVKKVNAIAPQKSTHVSLSDIVIVPYKLNKEFDEDSDTTLLWSGAYYQHK